MSAELLVTSGSGPIEARWFVAALADALGRRLPVVDRTTVGDPVAPSSVVLHVATDAVAGWLGTHALVRRSALRGRGRSRWFVGVSRLPEVPVPPALDPREVRLTACRAGGPGGQAVNTTSSAVLAVHLPTGLSVRVEEERSQHQNRRRALERLAVALARAAEAGSDDVRRERWLRHHRLVRGAPVACWRERSGALVPDGEDA